jgi:hypothetical protein
MVPALLYFGGINIVATANSDTVLKTLSLADAG